MTNQEAITIIKELMIACTSDSKYYKVGDIAIKALEQEPCDTCRHYENGCHWLPSVTLQEPEMVVLLEKTYADFCNCEGGEGWLKIDGKEYNTDVGYAIEGMRIFMEVLKQRLAESEAKE